MSETASIDACLLGRRSIRKYDQPKRISHEELSTDASSAPSKLNMQPWRFVIVESLKTKEKIKPLLTFNH